MKNISCLCLASAGLFILLCNSNQSHAQLYPGLRPGSGFSKTTWAPVPYSLSGSQSQEDSGDEWWYWHTNIYNDTGKQIGWVAAGYVSWRNEFYNEQQLYGKGCYIHNKIKTDTVGFELDSIQLPPEGRYKGSFWSAMARFDMQGNMLWCRRFAHGEFHHVIQNEEGNLVAIGMTQSTIDKNEDSLIYNPGLHNLKLGCDSSGASARRMYVVETDLNGNMLANYVYGNYEDDGVALRIESFGWTLTAVPPGNLLDSGGYLFIGYHQNSNSAKSNQGFVVLANRDLEMVDKQSVSLNEFEECELRAVARYGDSTATLYAFGGFHKDSSLDVKDAFVMVWSDDGTELFNKRIKDPLSFHRHGKVTDISFSNDGDIYLPALFENGWYKWDGYVYKLDP